jgi:hypothetical protein
MLGFSLVRTERLRKLEADSAALRRYQRGENKIAHENTPKKSVSARRSFRRG